MNRNELIQLVHAIRGCLERGDDVSSFRRTIEQSVPYPDVFDLICADYAADYVIDFSLGWSSQWPTLTRDNLLRLVKKIMAADGSDADISLDVLQFESNCNHPAGSDLIYYPDTHFPDIQGEPTPEQIVTTAMAPQRQSDRD